MKFFSKRNLVLGTVLGCCFQASAFAASPSMISNVRFHAGEEHDRIVFDMDRMPSSYEARTAEDGREIVLEMKGVSAKKIKKDTIHNDMIENVAYEEKRNNLQVRIALKEAAEYKVEKLQHPARVYIDVLKRSQNPSALEMDESLLGVSMPGPTRDFTQIQLAPGLKKTIYSRWNSDGPVTAYFIEADRSKYKLQPALDDGQVPGLGTVSYIADEYEAVAGVNASYFAGNGDILGNLKIDGLIAGTTYISRTAMGIMQDGSVIFGKPNYSGMVTIGDVSWPVGGVDAERGADSLVVYNRFYGPATRTNEYGREYIVKDGKVVDIGIGNTPIPEDGMVISVHGAAKEAFDTVVIGDDVTVEQDLGNVWNQAEQVMGAGPRLLDHGNVHVTAETEEFPSDIRHGRAPRSAFGVTKEGNYVLAVVDGRQASSHGCSLTEWASLLKQYGCVDAMNFDGGGSSELVVKGAVQNSPSDGGERRVGSALLILPKE